MKRINLLLLLLSTCIVAISTESCTIEESCPTINCNSGTVNESNCNCDCLTGFSGTNCEIEDACITQEIVCQNGGTCDQGVCDCPYGFFGTNCELFDTTSLVQALLNAGQTPKALFDLGISLDSLYGKTYMDGLIFYLNTTDGKGLVAAKENQSNDAEWGCISSGVNAYGALIGDGAANTTAILTRCMDDGIAAKLCRDLGTNWFLPSKEELSLMRANLYINGHGGFTNYLYWSSTEFDINFAWFQSFTWGTQNDANKSYSVCVRAARAF